MELIKPPSAILINKLKEFTAAKYTYGLWTCQETYLSCNINVAGGSSDYGCLFSPFKFKLAQPRRSSVS